MAQALSAAGTREFAFDEGDFRYLASLVYERSGIVLRDHKKDMVYTRLSRRLRALGLSNFKDYCRLIQGPDGDAEIGAMLNAITTNLTRFFREQHHFDHLRETVLAEATATARTGGSRRLRIWSAGCSSGEEPHSIAMVLRDAIPDLERWDARILATDLDTNMLATGRDGRYREDAIDGIPPELRARWVVAPKEEERGLLQMADPIRRPIAFKQLNLLHPWPMRGPFDAIFCRNVMIYFDAATKVDLVTRFAGLLKLGGWLYVGHSEALLDTTAHFELVGRTVYQRVA